VLSGFLWNGPPSQLLDAAERDAIELFTSDALLEELRDVLSRPKCARQLLDAGLTADRLLKLYSRAASAVDPVPVPRLAPDPDDDVVIGTAIAAKADLLVTGDRALLFVVRFENVRIVSVREALDAIARSIPRE
jgi:putative PIN family toxin of toxin-antitoxin system